MVAEHYHSLKKTTRPSNANFWLWYVLLYHYEIFTQPDHTPVTDLFYNKNPPDKAFCWSLTVQDFNPTSKYGPRKHNTVADALSQNTRLDTK